MKKKLLVPIIALSVMIFMAGCGGSSEKAAENTEGAAQIEEASEETVEESEVEEPVVETETIKRIKSETIDDKEYEYEYDEDGKLIESAKNYYEYDGDRVSRKYIKASYYCGNPECSDDFCMYHGLLMLFSEDASDVDVDLLKRGYDSYEEYTYDDNDNIATSLTYQMYDEGFELIDKWTYEYDSKNRVISKSNYRIDRESNAESLLFTYEFEYDDNDTITLTRSLGSEGNVIDEIVNELDESGRIVRGVLDQWSDGSMFTYEYDGDNYTRTSDVENWFTEWGDETYDCYFVDEYKFDDDGDLIYVRNQKIVDDPDFSYYGEDSVTTYEYEEIEVEI